MIDAGGSNEIRLTDEMGHEDPEWSPDGRRLAFTGWTDEAGRPGALGNWELFVINADGSDEQQITRSLRNDEYEPDWAPKGGRILVINRTGEAIGDRAAAVHSMRTDGSRRKNLTRGSTANDNPEWSPDGRRIVFASARDGNWNIYAMSGAGRGATRLTQSPHGTHNKAPSWSP